MPVNLWDQSKYSNLPDLDGLVYRSNLLGADRSVINIFGGNTSAKLTLKDHIGRDVRVLAVKASGSDVATIKESQFALLRLDEIDPIFELEEMSDEEMVAHLGRTAFEPGRPRQSIETLLHAFTPHTHIDHTHPDALISLASMPDPIEASKAVYGDRMAFVPYIRPGFTLSKWIAHQVIDNPQVECVIMGKHGLVTWGEDSRSCYEFTIKIIQEAEDYIADKKHGKTVFGVLSVEPVSREKRQDLMFQLLPRIRGAVSKRQPTILQYDDSDRVLDMVGRENTNDISQLGVACPDHLVHVKRKPLFIEWESSAGVEKLQERLEQSVKDFEQDYTDYFERNKVEGDEIRDAAPRVILIPGLGMVNTGKNIANARVSQQLYYRAIEVLEAGMALGGFESLTENEAYNVEYWPLELYKLKLAPPPKDLDGKIAIVTGAASGIGRATAYRLAQDGAHVVIADINQDDGKSVAQRIQEKYGDGRALFVHTDVTDEDAVINCMRETVLSYGGLDILVNNAGIAGGASVEDTTLQMWQKNMDVLATGYFLMAREAFKIMKAQRIGGSMVFVASKNSLTASKGAIAYNVAKAAELHMARCLAEEGGSLGIRVNTVLPDSVIRGSSIWDGEWRQARADQYGIDVSDIYEHYRQRNTLKVEILPEDLAEAIAFLAGPRSAKTTAGVITVDGGVPTSYVR